MTDIKSGLMMCSRYTKIGLGQWIRCGGLEGGVGTLLLRQGKQDSLEMPGIQRARLCSEIVILGGSEVSE